MPINIVFLGQPVYQHILNFNHGFKIPDRGRRPLNNQLEFHVA